MEKEEKKLLKNSILLMMGSFSSKFLVFFLVPFYTTVLTTEEYGISDLLLTTSNLLYPLLTVMISTAVLRFSMDKDSDLKQVLSTGFWIEIVGFGIMVFLSCVMFREGNLSEYKGYFLGYYATYSLYTLLLQYVKGRNMVAIYASASLVNTIIVIACNLLFLLQFKWGIHGYLLSMIFAHGLTLVYVFVASKAWKDFVLPNRIKKEFARSMVKYSLPLMINSLSWWISNSSDRYVMTFFCGVDELGIYSVAYKIPTIMSTITAIFMNAWEISAVDDFGTEKNRKFFTKIYFHYFNILIIIGASIILLVKPLAFILFQKDFFTAWRYAPTLVFAGVFNTLSGFLGTIFTAAKKTSSIFWTTMLGAILNIILNFCLIPLLGAQGAAIATAASYIIIYITRLISSSRIMKIETNHIANIFKLLILSLITALTCIGSYWAVLVGGVLLIIEWKYVVGLCSIVIKKFSQ